MGNLVKDVDMEDREGDGRLTLRGIGRKSVVRMWGAWDWLITVCSGGICWTFGFW